MSDIRQLAITHALFGNASKSIRCVRLAHWLLNKVVRADSITKSAHPHYDGPTCYHHQTDGIVHFCAVSQPRHVESSEFSTNMSFPVHEHIVFPQKWKQRQPRCRQTTRMLCQASENNERQIQKKIEKLNNDNTKVLTFCYVGATFAEISSLVVNC